MLHDKFQHISSIIKWVWFYNSIDCCSNRTFFTLAGIVHLYLSLLLSEICTGALVCTSVMTVLGKNLFKSLVLCQIVLVWILGGASRDSVTSDKIFPYHVRRKDTKDTVGRCIFWFRRWRRTAVRMTANDGACWVHAHNFVTDDGVTSIGKWFRSW